MPPFFINNLYIRNAGHSAQGAVTFFSSSSSFPFRFILFFIFFYYITIAQPVDRFSPPFLSSRTLCAAPSFIYIYQRPSVFPFCSLRICTKKRNRRRRTWIYPPHQSTGEKVSSSFFFSTPQVMTENRRIDKTPPVIVFFPSIAISLSMYTAANAAGYNLFKSEWL